MLKLIFGQKKHVLVWKKTKPLSLSVFQVGLLRRWYNLGSTLSFSKTFELNWTENVDLFQKKSNFYQKKTTKLNFRAKKHVLWFEKTKSLSLSVFQVGLPRRWCNLGSTLSFSDTFELKWTEKCRFCIKKE